MPAWRKYTKAAVQVTFKILGIIVSASPAISAVQEQSGTPGQIPKQVLYNYSGVDIENVAGGPNWGQAVAGIGAIIGGVLLAKIGGILARHV